MNSIRLTVVFDDPFWIGLFERKSLEGYSVAKIIFGAEPTEIEVYRKILNDYPKQFSSPVKGEVKQIITKNPKRKKREAQKELKHKHLISKAHEAIKQFISDTKLAKQKRAKQNKEQIEQKKFEQKQEKRKQKHRGH